VQLAFMLPHEYRDFLQQQKQCNINASNNNYRKGEIIMQEKLCQSCGNIMAETVYGTEVNGSESADYCKDCYDNGAFTNPSCTLEKMIEDVTLIMVGFGFSQEEASKQCKEGIPNLKRWK